MRNTQLENLIKNSSSVVDEEEGIVTYEINTEVIYRDEDNKIQVMAIGPKNEKPIKSVILLGQTGAGKTSVINAMINYLYGVSLEDNFRFHLKDQVIRENLLQVESQTEYITAYIVAHHPAMSYDCNYMLIDTPGFGDTRKDCESVPIERLNVFLTNNYGIDDLNCVALVAKANQNRVSKYQIQMLEEFTSVLGNNIGDITQLLATFASDDTSPVVDVVRHARIQFVNSYQLDNWPLYALRNDNASQEDRLTFLKYRWNRMQAEYAKFFEDLQKSIPVNLRKTRDLLQEKKSFEETKALLINNIKNIVKLRDPIRDQQEELSKIKKQANKLEKNSRVECPMISGYHVHNCDICQKTCKKMCEDPNNLIAAVTGTGTGAGTALLAGIGSALGAGALMGTQVGIFGGPVGAAIGLGIGSLVGLSTGLVTGLLTRKAKEECLAYLNEPCNSDGCNHELKNHRTETQYVWKKVVDPLDKAKYEKYMSTMKELRIQIKDNNKTLGELQEGIIVIAKAFVIHINKINELSLKQINLNSIIDEIILNEKENYLHIDLVNKFRSTVMQLSSVCTSEEHSTTNSTVTGVEVTDAHEH